MKTNVSVDIKMWTFFAMNLMRNTGWRGIFYKKYSHGGFELFQGNQSQNIDILDDQQLVKPSYFVSLFCISFSYYINNNIDR